MNTDVVLSPLEDEGLAQSPWAEQLALRGHQHGESNATQMTWLGSHQAAPITHLQAKAPKEEATGPAVAKPDPARCGRNPGRDADPGRAEPGADRCAGGPAAGHPGEPG